MARKKRGNDAIPSWSGFNYQGKVMLLHVLQRMNVLLGKVALSEYSVELEKREDFVIFHTGKSESFHQVKATLSKSKWSSHSAALDKLIQNRNSSDNPAAPCYFVVAKGIDDWNNTSNTYSSSITLFEYEGKKEDAILAAIAKENRLFENDRGLAEYIHDEALKRKVYSLYPSVEIVDGELWGVMTAGLKESPLGEEIAELLEFVTGQNSDGYGEGLEQRPIKTPDGEIYVSFWNRENYTLKLEQEMKNNSPDLGYEGQVMG